MTPQEAYRAGLDAPKGGRCPFVDATLAAEWVKGRNQRNRIGRADLRPAFRKSGKRFERYHPAHCR